MVYDSSPQYKGSLQNKSSRNLSPISMFTPAKNKEINNEVNKEDINFKRFNKTYNGSKY